MKINNAHAYILNAIGELGLEKFCEIAGECCAELGARCKSSDEKARQHFQAQWEMIGENLRGLASSARAALIGGTFQPTYRDPRDPDHTRTGIFVNHNCTGCRNGALPCREGNSRSCSYLHARND